MLVKIGPRLAIAGVLVIELTACGGPTKTSLRTGSTSEAPKSETAAAPDAAAAGTKATADATAGDTTLVMADYSTPRQAAITPPKTDDVLALLPAKCDGSAGNGTTVALTVASKCQELTKDDARTRLTPIIASLAAYGIDARQVLAAGKAMPDTPTTVADPKIDLATLVPKQAALATPTASPATSADGHLGGAVGPVTLGSEQFGVTVDGRAQMWWKGGIGLDAGVDASGKAFGKSMELLTCSLQGNLADGQKATVTGKIRLFGQDLLNRTLAESEFQRAGDDAKFNRSQQGSLHFSLGPVPFSATWHVSLTGSAPWQVAITSSQQSAAVTPSAVATASLAGGPSLGFASAGVDGEFTILDSTLSSAMDGSLKTDSGASTFCYRINSALQSRLFAGFLSAYAEIGYPDSTANGHPLGWRGAMDFVRSQGSDYALTIFKTGDAPICVR